MNNVDIFHQCGHNDVWNFDIYSKDDVGEGLIFAPKMANSKKIKLYSDEVKVKSFFDPQFYYPKSTKNKFSEFDFFPNTITGEYSTNSYEELCSIAANKCVKFQVAQDYRFIVIPTIVYDETPKKYLETLRELYIEPFIKEISNQNKNCKKVLLSVVIKDTQLADEDYINELLNLITSYDEIDGIYLIPYFKVVNKRIRDINTIVDFMKFINNLKENDMYVHLAYCDIEGLIFSLANIDSVSIGAFENMRKFNLDDFIEKNNQGHPNAPKQRIYSNELLQWIDFDYIGALSKLDCFNDLFDKNKYIDFTVHHEKNWHFNNPELYKHYMMTIYNQYKSLPQDYDKRYKYINKRIINAIRVNKIIENNGILLDDKNNGEHLFRWATAINQYNNFIKGE